jgi:hypothetical protein
MYCLHLPKSKPSNQNTAAVLNLHIIFLWNISNFYQDITSKKTVLFIVTVTTTSHKIFNKCRLKLRIKTIHDNKEHTLCSQIRMAITCPICPESHCTGSMMKKTDIIALLIALQNYDTWINEAILTIFNENTSVRNQTMRVLFITTYTALHVSAFMQAIFKCYQTILQKSSY